MEQKQIDVLMKQTGHDFKFVSADKTPFFADSYQCIVDDDKEIERIKRVLAFADIYCTGYKDKNGRNVIVVVDSFMAQDRVDGMSGNPEKYKDMVSPIGRINNKDVYLELIPVGSDSFTVVEHHHRAIAVVNINGKRLPFYVSSGLSGKEDAHGIASGSWYPLQGVSTNWLNKFRDFFGREYEELGQICKMLENKYPARQMKQMALDNKLPRADIGILMTVANYSLPEGVTDHAMPNHVYGKNEEVYVKNIIHRWRSAPINWLDSPGGGLITDEQRELEKLQKKLDVRLVLDDDILWLQANDMYPSSDALMRYLHTLGIFINQSVDRGNNRELGVPFDKLIHASKAESIKSFAAASTKIKTKQLGLIEGIRNILKDSVNG